MINIKRVCRISNDLKLGIAQNVKDGIAPINGLRMPIENGTTGWYIWAGEEMGKEDFFLPLRSTY